jgi:oligoendopeptidase F
MESGLWSAEGAKALKQRSEVPAKYTWNLSDIYPSNDQWERDCQIIEGMIPEMVTYKGTLAQSPEKMLSFFKAREKLFLLYGKAEIYAGLLNDEDTRVQEPIAMYDRIQKIGTKVDESLSWASPEIVAIPREKIEQFLSSNRELAIYRHDLENELRMKEHTLSPAEERIIALAGDVMGSSETISQTLADTDLKFPTMFDEDSVEVTLSEGRYYAFVQSPNRRVRREAAEKLLNSYIGFKNTFASTMSANLAKDVFYARARGYSSCLEAALDPDNVKVEVYENLIKTVSANVAPLQKYIELRRKFLGLDEIHLYDMMAPLIPAEKENVEYDAGVEKVKAALAPLGKDYLRIASEGFASRWIDVYETQGKRTGGYSWGTYGAPHPYILLNYNNTLDDVFTTAHEMGHSMHSYLTTHNQPFVYGDYSYFVAEVASTTNEALLMDYLLKQTKDPTKKLYLISQWIDQIRTTVIRQTIFADWEERANKLAESGEGVTAESLTQIYHDLLRKYYGPGMTYDEYYDSEWARIPHFYRGFYVYKYATSYCASSAISQKILKNEKGAADAYLTFLKSGSSDYPIEQLKKAGVDMSTPAPVEETMKLFSHLVDEMEKLMQETRK